MKGMEIDMVVPDSLEAVALYETVFEVERLEIGDFVKGQNEAVIHIYGTRFHLLDENPAYQLNAPKPGVVLPIWFNVVVPDIKLTYAKAMAAGCTEVQPLTELPEMGIINAMFADPIGYVWMLHQIDKIVSFEERCRMMEAQGAERRGKRESENSL